MSKPTCRELLGAITHGVVMRGAAPDGISKDEALEIGSDLAARVERVLAACDEDLENYGEAAIFARRIKRLLDGEDL